MIFLLRIQSVSVKDRCFQAQMTIHADLCKHALLVSFENLSYTEFDQQNKEETDFTIPGFHKTTFLT